MTQGINPGYEGSLCSLHSEANWDLLHWSQVRSTVLGAVDPSNHYCRAITDRFSLRSLVEMKDCLLEPFSLGHGYVLFWSYFSLKNHMYAFNRSFFFSFTFWPFQEHESQIGMNLTQVTHHLKAVYMLQK